MGKPSIPGEDLIPSLWAAAAKADADLRPLLLEAALTIDTLRTLVSISEEVLLEDAEPERNA